MTAVTAPVSNWNAANGFTALRLVAVPAFILLMLQEDGGSAGWRLAATAAFGVAALTDRLDGELARRWGQVTTLGKIADPIADKALVGSALICLSLVGELPWWVTVLVLARELAITLIRFLVIRHGVLPATRGGKWKTATQTVALLLYLLPLPGALHPVEVLAMGVAVVLTVVTGLDYLVQAIRLRQGSEHTRRKRAARSPSVR